eukprot:Rmarinus@m.27271
MDARTTEEKQNAVKSEIARLDASMKSLWPSWGSSGFLKRVQDSQEHAFSLTDAPQFSSPSLDDLVSAAGTHTMKPFDGFSVASAPTAAGSVGAVPLSSGRPSEHGMDSVSVLASPSPVSDHSSSSSCSFSPSGPAGSEGRISDGREAASGRDERSKGQERLPRESDSLRKGRSEDYVTSDFRAAQDNQRADHGSHEGVRMQAGDSSSDINLHRQKPQQAVYDAVLNSTADNLTSVLQSFATSRLGDPHTPQGKSQQQSHRSPSRGSQFLSQSSQRIFGDESMNFSTGRADVQGDEDAHTLQTLDRSVEESQAIAQRYWMRSQGLKADLAKSHSSVVSLALQKPASAWTSATAGSDRESRCGEREKSASTGAGKKCVSSTEPAGKKVRRVSSKKKEAGTRGKTVGSASARTRDTKKKSTARTLSSARLSNQSNSKETSQLLSAAQLRTCDPLEETTKEIDPFADPWANANVHQAATPEDLQAVQERIRALSEKLQIPLRQVSDTTPLKPRRSPRKEKETTSSHRRPHTTTNPIPANATKRTPATVADPAHVNTHTPITCHRHIPHNSGPVRTDETLGSGPEAGLSYFQSVSDADESARIRRLRASIGDESDSDRGLRSRSTESLTQVGNARGKLARALRLNDKLQKVRVDHEYQIASLNHKLRQTQSRLQIYEEDHKKLGALQAEFSALRASFDASERVRERQRDIIRHLKEENERLAGEVERYKARRRKKLDSAKTTLAKRWR